MGVPLPPLLSFSQPSGSHPSLFGSIFPIGFADIRPSALEKTTETAHRITV
jgi:hypothetical protein